MSDWHHGDKFKNNIVDKGIYDSSRFNKNLHDPPNYFKNMKLSIFPRFSKDTHQHDKSIVPILKPTELTTKSYQYQNIGQFPNKSNQESQYLSPKNGIHKELKQLPVFDNSLNRSRDLYLNDPIHKSHFHTDRTHSSRNVPPMIQQPQPMKAYHIESKQLMREEVNPPKSTNGDRYHNQVKLGIPFPGNRNISNNQMKSSLSLNAEYVGMNSRGSIPPVNVPQSSLANSKFKIYPETRHNLFKKRYDSNIPKQDGSIVPETNSGNQKNHIHESGFQSRLKHSINNGEKNLKYLKADNMANNKARVVNNSEMPDRKSVV